MPAVAVVGAGPSGIFAAAEVLRSSSLDVDVLDRAATPYGLVRYGVAPDHPRIKSVVATLQKVFADPRTTFLGNVDLGTDVTVDELRGAYDAVVIATGARRGRLLDVPGAALPNSLAAAELVAWYNGRPGAVNPFTGEVRTVAVVGAGNVSLDVARVLLKGSAGLGETDVPLDVLGAMADNPVDAVDIVVRAGVTGTKFSLPELLELDKLPGLTIAVHPAAVRLGPAEEEARAGNRRLGMRVDLFRRWAANWPARPGGGTKVLRLRFHAVPTAITGPDRVAGLALETPAGSTVIPVQAVVHSIGYVGEEIPGLPFDDISGVVPHEGGRVTEGVYVAGWIKRGPSGIIGTNKACATESVTRMLAEHALRRAVPDSARDRLHDLLRERGCTVVDWAGWTAIDDAEIALGRRHGRGRIKIRDASELIRLGSRQR